MLGDEFSGCFVAHVPPVARNENRRIRIKKAPDSWVQHEAKGRMDGLIRQTEKLEIMDVTPD